MQLGYSLRSLTANLARSRIQSIQADREHQERSKLQAVTKERLDEALRDFSKFASLVDIVPKNNKRIAFSPNRIQREYSAARSARDIILKARQQGVTTVEQIRDLFYFLTVPGARVVVVCQSITGQAPLKQLAQNFRIMLDSLQRAGMRLNFTTDATGEWVLADRDSSLKIVVAGASEASAKKKGRAGTISRLHVTECAFFEHADSTLNAMLECVPSVADGSEIVIESTANGASGFFYDKCKAAEKKEGGFQFHFYPWYFSEEYATPLEPGETCEPSQNADPERREREEVLIGKGITAEQLKWYRAKVVDKGQDKTDQEYPSDPDTCFLGSGRQFFERTVTASLITRSSEPIEVRYSGRLAIWQKPQRDSYYLISADTSEGVDDKNDSSALIVREYETNALCARLSGLYTPWQLAEELAKLGWEYNEALVIVERNNHGHSTLQALAHLMENGVSRPYTNVYHAEDGKAGWNTTPITRPVMLDALEDAHRNGFWNSACKLTLDQIKNFVIAKSGKPQAAHGKHDDLVIAEAILWTVRQTVNFNMHVGGTSGRGWR
jgi:hypothetical protein